MRALDLFAGTGWGVACRRLGISEDGVENMPEAVATRKAAGMNTRWLDVRDVPNNAAAEYDILIASPPCQSFSLAGRGGGREALNDVLAGVKALAAGEQPDRTTDDERTWLVLEPLRLALHGRPRFLAWEQVPSVLPVWEACADVLRACGYDVETGVLCAGDYGVPQLRKRAVLVARLGGKIGFPAPMCASPVTIGDVLPERRGWEMHGLRGAGMVARYGTRPGRRSDQPAFTVLAWKDSRVVWVRGDEREAPTTRELALLQTFPGDFPFAGSVTTQHKQIGNAVPPLLAEAILRVFLGAA